MPAMTIAGPPPRNGTTTDPNIGVLLNAKEHHLGMVPRRVYSHHPIESRRQGSRAVCASVSSDSATGLSNVTDYVSHHNGFAYNFSDGQPASPAADRSPLARRTRPITNTTSACFFRNHRRNLPSVTFVKAKKFQNGHPGNSTPLDEQTWLATAVNAIEEQQILGRYRDFHHLRRLRWLVRPSNGHRRQSVQQRQR